jgi:hypothetical protein
MNEEIEELLNNWNKIKENISMLEKKMEQCKHTAEKLMDNNNTDKLDSKLYTLERRELNRTSISKKDLPEEIWNRFSKESFYNVFYLTQKNKKIKKSNKKNRKQTLY